MKKLFLAIALSVTAAVCVNAQNLSSLSKAARLAYDYLAKEGYKPTIDEDNDVAFKYQGYNLYVDNDTSDPTYLDIYAPGVYEVDLDDAEQVSDILTVCNNYNRSKKMIKVYLNKAGGVTFSSECYIGDSKDLTEVIETTLDFMMRGIPIFRDMYNEL